jgi:hypothetical protein
MNWRRLRADLSNLSNGVFYYPLLIAFAWFTYNSVYSMSGDKDLQAIPPLLALFAASLVSIATERQDKVADRIAIELGGPRTRLKVRMLSLAIANSSLVGLGLTATFLQHGTIGSSPIRTIATAVVLTLIISTIGTLAASYIPHPLVALVITFFLLSWGGSDPEQNWGLAHLLNMLRAASFADWIWAILAFTAPWLIGGAALLAFSYCRPLLAGWKTRVPAVASNRRTNVPSWLNDKRHFIKTALVGMLTNPLPILALVACLGLYSFGTINLAAKFATFSTGVSLFAALPGLLFANVIPALILAGTSQRREAVEQESLLYQSQRRAMAAQILQQMSFIAVTLIGFMVLLSSILTVRLSEPTVIRGILWALVLSPGFATISVYLNRVIRLPLISGLVSYLLTLPEIFLAKFVPETRPYLPSSLFSILIGGESSYTKTFTPTAVFVAYILGIALVILPFLTFIPVRFGLMRSIAGFFLLSSSAWLFCFVWSMSATASENLINAVEAGIPDTVSQATWLGIVVGMIALLLALSTLLNLIPLPFLTVFKAWEKPIVFAAPISLVSLTPLIGTPTPLVPFIVIAVCLTLRLERVAGSRTKQRKQGA